MQAKRFEQRHRSREVTAIDSGRMRHMVEEVKLAARKKSRSAGGGRPRKVYVSPLKTGAARNPWGKKK